MSADASNSRSPSEQALRQMVDHAGVGLFETSVDGSFVFLNEAHAQMLGYASAADFWAEGRSSTSFYVDPEDQRRHREQVAREGRLHGLLVLARRRDGALIWVREHSTVLRDAEGRITGYAGSATDVTDLVDIQNRLEETEASYRRIFERVTEGIYRSTLDGRQLRANPALTRLNGYASEAEQLEAVKDIAKEWYVDPERRAEFKRAMERDGVIEGFESEIYRHATRERIWVSENAYLVRDENGEPLYFEGTVRDITRRKHAERELQDALRAAEEANRTKTRFLAHMSHELRTPLNAILGFSDMLRSVDLAHLRPERMQEYAEHIHRSGSHLLDLINDVLDLSRIESDAFPIHPEALDVTLEVEEAVATVNPLAEARGVTLDRSAVTPALQVLADRRALHQCLLNMLSNAVKFSPDGGTVTISAAADGDALALAIADHGPGIPKALLDRLGEPFNTLDHPDRQTQPGTGLGLAITQALLQRMGGELQLESELGQGTRAGLRLPLAAESGPAEPAAPGTSGRVPG